MANAGNQVQVNQCTCVPTMRTVAIMTLQNILTATGNRNHSVSDLVNPWKCRWFGLLLSVGVTETVAVTLLIWVTFRCQVTLLKRPICNRWSDADLGYFKCLETLQRRL